MSKIDEVLNKFWDVMYSRVCFFFFFFLKKKKERKKETQTLELYPRPGASQVA